MTGDAPFAVAKEPRNLTPHDIGAMRRWWRAPESPITVRRDLRPRDLRFCAEGEALSHSTVGEWFTLLADLLRDKLDHHVAPCTRSGAGPDRVRSVHPSEVDWSALEPREWASLERYGVPRALRLRLEAGEPAEESEDPARTAALEAATGLLSHVPDGTPTERLDAATGLLRDALYDDALSRAGGNRKRAAEVLGVPAQRVTEAIARSEYLTARWPPGPRGPRPMSERDE